MMKLHSSVFLSGKVLARCVSGNAVVHGFSLNPEVGWQKIFSPSSHSLLAIKAVAGVTTVGEGDGVDDWMTALSYKERQQVVSASIAYPVVLLLQRLKCPVYDFVSFDNDFKRLCSQVSGSYLQSVDVTVVGADSNVSAVVEPESFSCTADEFVRCIKEGTVPSMVVCGGLNSGKSTLCRYIINFALNHVKQVAYLECDPGQTEFTPPACLSLHLITEPVLGPPCSHQRKAHSSEFIGRPSPSGCAELYIRAIQHIYAAYLKLSSRHPLIVNTMGWMKDDGLCLLVDTLRIIQPSFVVQLRMDVSRETKHVPNITPGFVANKPGLIYNQVFENAPLPGHRWIKLLSEVHRHQWRGSHGKAAWQRDLATLGYLGRVFDHSRTVKSLRAIIPYRVAWSDVAVHVCHEVVPKSQILYAINGNIVALCIADDNQIVKTDVPGSCKFLRNGAVCECVGFGIVRSICAKEQALYVLSPVMPSVLERVNCIQSGAVRIPRCLRITSESVACEEPYVDILHKVPYVRRQRKKRRRTGCQPTSDSSVLTTDDRTALNTSLDCDYLTLHDESE